MSKLADYSKWDNFSSDDSDENDEPASLSPSGSFSERLDRASELYDLNRTREALAVYSSLLLDMGVKPRELPLKGCRLAQTAVPAHSLLRLYVNMAACHHRLDGFGEAHHFASAGGVGVVRANSWMSVESDLPVPVLLLRARAFHISAASSFAVSSQALSSLSNSQKPSAVRPMLIRSKADFKQAVEFFAKLDASDFTKEATKGLEQAESLLSTHFPKSVAGVSDGGPQKPNDKASSQTVVEEMLKEAKKRLDQKQFSAAEQTLNFLLSKPLEPKLMRTAALMRARALEMGGKVKEAAGALEDLAASSASSQNEKPKICRKAGLLYLQLRDYAAATRSFSRALDKLEKCSTDSSSEGVFTLDSSGNMSPEGETLSEADRLTAQVANLTNLAGIQCTKKDYTAALATISRAAPLLPSLPPGKATTLQRLTTIEVQSDALAGLRTFSPAIERALEAVALARELSLPDREASAHTSLGHMFRFSGSPDKALSHFTFAARCYTAASMHTLAGQTYITMASLSSEDQASALMHLSSSLAAFSSEKPPTSSSLAGQYHAGRSLGFVQKKMKKTSPLTAFEAALSALTHGLMATAPEDAGRVPFEVGLLLETSSPERAKKCFKQAEAMYDREGKVSLSRMAAEKAQQCSAA